MNSSKPNSPDNPRRKPPEGAPGPNVPGGGVPPARPVSRGWGDSLPPSPAPSYPAPPGMPELPEGLTSSLLPTDSVLPQEGQEQLWKDTLPPQGHGGPDLPLHPAAMPDYSPPSNYPAPDFLGGPRTGTPPPVPPVIAPPPQNLWTDTVPPQRKTPPQPAAGPGARPPATPVPPTPAIVPPPGMPVPNMPVQGMPVPGLPVPPNMPMQGMPVPPNMPAGSWNVESEPGRQALPNPAAGSFGAPGYESGGYGSGGYGSAGYGGEAGTEVPGDVGSLVDSWGSSGPGGANPLWSRSLPPSIPATEGQQSGRDAATAVDSVSGPQSVQGKSTVGDSRAVRATYQNPHAPGLSPGAIGGGPQANDPGAGAPVVGAQGGPDPAAGMFRDSMPPSPTQSPAPLGEGSWAGLDQLFPRQVMESNILRSTGKTGPNPLASSGVPAGEEKSQLYASQPPSSTTLMPGESQAPPAGSRPTPPIPNAAAAPTPPVRGAMPLGAPAGLFQSNPPTPQMPSDGGVFDSRPPAPFRAPRPVHMDEVLARPVRTEQIEGNAAVRDDKLEQSNKLWGNSLAPGEAAAQAITASSINAALVAPGGRITDSRAKLADQIERIWATSSMDVEQYHVHQTISRRNRVGKMTIGDNLKMRTVVEARKDGKANLAADYENLSMLGEGGMGKVWLSRQAGLNRDLAIKMLRADYAGDEDIRARFLAEAVATAALEHPGVIPVHELGRTENKDLFYSMKRVKGNPWCDLLGKKTLRENIEILIRVCDAVAYAHSEFILHRDLKPENVMLGDYGEVYVMDWGLSVSVDPRGKAFKAEDRENQAGTPAYMSPEMACGWESKLTEAGDVYLLGAMLFEVLTHMPPHTGANIKQCLINAAANEIVSFDRDKLPRGGVELMQIALKAMATEPEERYPTVKEFQQSLRDFESHHDSVDLASRAARHFENARAAKRYDDFAQAMFGYRAALDKWASNEEAREGLRSASREYAEAAFERGDFDLSESLLPELGNDPELAARIKKQKLTREANDRTRKRLWGGIVLAGTVMIVGLGFGLVTLEGARQYAMMQQREAVDQKKEADRQKQVAVTEKDAADVARQRADEAKAEAVAANARLQTALEAADAARKDALAKKAEADDAKKKADEAAALAVKEKTEADMARAEAVKANEKTKAALEEVNAAQGKILTEQKKAVYEAYVAKVGLYQTKIEQNFFRQGGDDFAVILAAPGNPVEADQRNWEWGRLKYLCSLSEETFPLPGTAPRPIALVASPDGSRVLVATRDRLFLWEAGKPAATQVGGNLRLEVTCLAAARDGQILIGTFDGMVYVTDWRNTPPKPWFADGKPDLAQGGISALAFSEFDDQKQVLIGYTAGTARRWGRDGKPLQGERLYAGGHVKDGAGKPITGLALLPDGRLATGGQDGRLNIWSKAGTVMGYKSGLVFRTPDGSPLTAVVAARYGEKHPADFNELLVAGRNGALVLFSVPSEERTGNLIPAAVVRAHDGGVNSLALAYEANQLLCLTAGADNVVRVHLVVAPQDRVKDAAAQLLVELPGETLRGHGGSVIGVAEPSPTRAWTASDDGTVRQWNPQVARERFVLATGGGPDGAAAIGTLGEIRNAGGRRLVAAAGDLGTAVWNRGSQQPAWGEVQLLREGHSDRSTWIDVHEGKRLAVTCAPLDGNDRSIRVWDLAAGKELRTLEPPKEPGKPEPKYVVKMVKFSPDGTKLLSGGSDGVIRLWDWEKGTFRAYAVPNLGADPAVHSVAFRSEDSILIGLKTTVRELTWGPAGDPKPDFEYKGHHSEEIVDLALLKDGKGFLSASQDKTVVAWKFRSSDPQAGLPAGAPIRRMVFDPNAERVYLADNNNRLSIWDLGSEKRINNKSIEIGSTILSLALSGNEVLVVSNDGKLFRLNRETGDQIGFPQSVAPGDRMRYCAVAGLPDGKLLTARYRQGYGSELELWPTAELKNRTTLFGAHKPVVGAGLLPDGVHVLAAAKDGRLTRWNADRGQVEQVFPAVGQGELSAFALHPDGARVALGSENGEVLLVNTADGKLLKQTLVPQQTGHVRVNGLAWSADGGLLAICADDGKARLWNSDAAEPTVLPSPDKARPLAAAFNAAGTRLALAYADGLATVWKADPANPAGWFREYELRGHSEAVETVAFSADGERILTGSRDGTVKVWDADLGPGREDQPQATELMSLSAGSPVKVVRFSPDGFDAEAGTENGQVVIWPADAWKPAKAAPAAAAE